MPDNTKNIQELKDIMAKFVKERDWNQFHSPKNLSISIAIEAAELMEKFQWCDSKESYAEVLKNKEEIIQELGDIFSYMLSFCNATEIDLSDAFINKLKLNAAKYPVDKCKGKSDKYNKL